MSSNQNNKNKKKIIILKHLIYNKSIRPNMFQNFAKTTRTIGIKAIQEILKNIYKKENQF